jgi:hypothetical protein
MYSTRSGASGASGALKSKFWGANKI